MIEDYNFDIKYINLDLNGEVATAYVNYMSSIKYNFLNEVFSDSVYHEIMLVKEKGQWYIYDDKYSEEFKDTYGMNIDFDSLSQNVKSDYEKYIDKAKQEKDLKIDEKQLLADDQINSVPGDYTVLYDSTARSNAVNYALKYTSNTGEYEGTNYNNTQFSYFSDKNDCQNYVSQCIWYGFGGRSSVGRDLPMTYDWYADTKVNTTSWVSCSSFKSYITNNETTDGYGVHGRGFTSTSYVGKGDYVYDTSGHVMFITGVSDTNGNGSTDWAEIYISAHTRNRKNTNLKALYSGVSVPPSDFLFMRIYHYKWNNGY